MTLLSISESARNTLEAAALAPIERASGELVEGIDNLERLVRAGRSMPAADVVLIDRLVALGRSCRGDAARLQGVLEVASALRTAPDAQVLARAAAAVANRSHSMVAIPKNPLRRREGEVRVLQTGAQALGMVAQAMAGPVGTLVQSMCEQALTSTSAPGPAMGRAAWTTGTLLGALVTVATVGMADRERLQRTADQLLKINLQGEERTALLAFGVRALELAARSVDDLPVLAILSQIHPELKALEALAKGEALPLGTETGSVEEGPGQAQIGEVALPSPS